MFMGVQGEKRGTGRVKLNFQGKREFNFYISLACSKDQQYEQYYLVDVSITLPDTYKFSLEFSHDWGLSENTGLQPVPNLT